MNQTPFLLVSSPLPTHPITCPVSLRSFHFSPSLDSSVLNGIVKKSGKYQKNWSVTSVSLNHAKGPEKNERGNSGNTCQVSFIIILWWITLYLSTGRDQDTTVTKNIQQNNLGVLLRIPSFCPPWQKNNTWSFDSETLQLNKFQCEDCLRFGTFWSNRGSWVFDDRGWGMGWLSDPHRSKEECTSL